MAMSSQRLRLRRSGAKDSPDFSALPNGGATGASPSGWSRNFANQTTAQSTPTAPKIQNEARQPNRC